MVLWRVLKGDLSSKRFLIYKEKHNGDFCCFDDPKYDEKYLIVVMMSTVVMIVLIPSVLSFAVLSFLVLSDLLVERDHDQWYKYVYSSLMIDISCKCYLLFSIPSSTLLLLTPFQSCLEVLDFIKFVGYYSINLPHKLLSLSLPGLVVI